MQLWPLTLLSHRCSFIRRIRKSDSRTHKTSWFQYEFLMNSYCISKSNVLTHFHNYSQFQIHINCKNACYIYYLCHRPPWLPQNTYTYIPIYLWPILKDLHFQQKKCASGLRATDRRAKTVVAGGWGERADTHNFVLIGSTPQRDQNDWGSIKWQ